MQHAATRLSEHDGVPDALEIVEYAHQKTNACGSSTACVAVMRPNGCLQVANLGDSGLRVFRGTQCIFATKIQEHEFNMPFQLADPDILKDTDWPSDADVYDIDIQPGDVVVMGSDGLFDNVWNDDLAKIVSTSLAVNGTNKRDVSDAEALARRIAEIAHSNAENSDVRTPWAVEVATKGQRSFFDRLFPRGGKMDDCTVIVGIIQEV